MYFFFYFSDIQKAETVLVSRPVRVAWSWVKNAQECLSSGRKMEEIFAECTADPSMPVVAEYFFSWNAVK